MMDTHDRAGRRAKKEGRVFHVDVDRMIRQEPTKRDAAQAISRFAKQYAPGLERRIVNSLSTFPSFNKLPDH